ncbi:sodium:alanine symporter family protein [Parachlamydia sp. AcF125]|uniref:alanine/glycine:cation symporter family protein n=1 Tax=Parachlamydia sp. AcF125 TaxID=2795736 RepID=UPI001BC97C70|nr:sodium:alanine symporter family protein [Parachlamydia sp. AcF125]MBS4167466.1 Amino-acid carrier protein AlsT [Parachlamydia sp. AcF125]
MDFLKFLHAVYGIVWGFPLLILLMGIGVYLTIVLKGLQFSYLGYALRLGLGLDKAKEGKGDISHFQSLMTALAATVGIGNIAGVAAAITIGGLGALFWMWVTALIGMITKFAEALLALKYRTIDAKGEMCGGPMYFIEKGLGWKWLSLIFAASGAIAAFGGGNMLQANSVADVMFSFFQLDPLWTGSAMAILMGLTLLGGIKSIGKAASILVPFMGIIYIGGGLLVLLKCYKQIPTAAWGIFSHAFTGQAAVGGFAGSTLLLSMQVGISRGLMTSEAGLGTASIAAAAAKSDVPGRQAMVSMTGSFLATVVMCTITGLILSVTNLLGEVGPDGKMLTGATMTLTAFQSVFDWGGYVVSLGLVLFAFTTLLGWAYYGEKCVEYMWGRKIVPLYRVIFSLMIIPGAILELETVWLISDIFNGLMAFPNLVGLCGLSGAVIAETREFLKELEAERAQKLAPSKA